MTEKNIFQATLAIKDKIAHLKANGRAAKLIGFDLDHAFDRVDQHFLFKTMRSLGINVELVNLLSNIAAVSSSRVLINGYLSASFPIQRSVRQGDSLSMHLFVLYLHPLLRKLEQVCGGDLIVAYADDISAIVTRVDQIDAMRSLFRSFGRVSGARMNEAKTIAIDVGALTNPLVVPWLRTDATMRILGVIFSNSVREMVSLNWDTLVTNFSRQVWLHSMRNLTLQQKVTLLNTFLCSKMWYIGAQLAPSAAHLAKVTATIRRYLFRGMDATVPMQQLARNREDGGVKLHLPAFKCQALLVNRHMHEIESLPHYSSLLHQANPPRANDIADLPCLKIILNNYPTLPFQIHQHPSADLINRFLIERTDRPKVEVENPNTNWRQVWKNISARALSSVERSTLYIWVNQKIPHRRLLSRMRRTDGDQCTHCAAAVETVQHKFFDCPRVNEATRLLQQKLAAIFPVGRRVFDSGELMRPALERLSARKKSTVLKHLVVYITFIDNCNGRVDTDELNFAFQVVV